MLVGLDSACKHVQQSVLVLALVMPVDVDVGMMWLHFSSFAEIHKESVCMCTSMDTHRITAALCVRDVNGFMTALVVSCHNA